MEKFRTDNTEGYTQAELDALNIEWEDIVVEKQLKKNTDEYDTEAKRFADTVARR